MKALHQMGEKVLEARAATWPCCCQARRSAWYKAAAADLLVRLRPNTDTAHQYPC